MSKHDELLALTEEVNKSDALKYEGRIDTLRMSFFVFHRNHEELKKFIGLKDNPQKMMELWDLQNRHKLETFLNELLRLFQNYLASAMSLVEQTRVAVREWYKGTDFLKEYQNQINIRFKENSLSGFIEDLRNYNLHYSLPITHATFAFHSDDTQKGSGTLHFSFVLIKAGLLTWSGWKKGKEYLSNSSGDIDIGKLADEYHKQIADFHLWLVNRLLEIHKEDFLWLEEMRQKTINAMSQEERKSRGLM
jgi:hypothetical protein